MYMKSPNMSAGEAAPDLDLRDKLKGVMDLRDGGNQIHKIDSDWRDKLKGVYQIHKFDSDLDLRDKLKGFDSAEASNQKARDKLKGGNQIHKIDSAEATNLGFDLQATDLGFVLRDKPKGGNQNHKIDSAKARPARQVSEFTDDDTVDLLSVYKKKMIFEREDYDPVGNYFNRLGHKRKEEMECIKKNPSDISQIRNRCVIEIEYMEKNPFDREAVLKYISQVRNSDGFDVDVCLADWLHPGLVNFIPVDMSVPSHRDLTYRLAKFVTSEINVDMKSETFEFVEVVKAVTSMISMGLMYLTLAVKNREEAATSTITIQAIVSYHRRAPWTLRQWRVKPEARAVEDCFILPLC